MTSGWHRRRRAVAASVLALALLVVSPFIGLSVIALTSPYASVIVPPGCATAVEPTDAGGSIEIPGHDPGTLLATTDARAVAVTVGAAPSRLQLDAEVTAFGLGDAPISHDTFDLVGVVDGCVLGR